MPCLTQVRTPFGTRTGYVGYLQKYLQHPGFAETHFLYSRDALYFPFGITHPVPGIDVLMLQQPMTGDPQPVEIAS